MKGYKAFNKDLTCMGFQYEIGKTYEFDGPPIICNQGFHFCETISDCYLYYPMLDSTRICEIEAIGDIMSSINGLKYCTNKIKIVREIENFYERRGNINETSVLGYCNSGNYNVGNLNTGDHNTGDCNTGNRNTGEFNIGGYNTGNFNIGDYNTGWYNTGNYNTGCSNAGGSNTGDWNAGDRNTGDFNIGDFNTGNFNTGMFCTETPKLTFFDKPSTYSFCDWGNSIAKEILQTIPTCMIDFVSIDEMSEEEKK